MMKSDKKHGICDYLLMHGAFFLYSMCSLFSKNAALSETFSFSFFVFYGLMLLDLAVYALLWQQVLKRFPLTFAYANKAVVIAWGLLWGAVVFHETITPQMILGALVIMVGVGVVVTDRE